MYTVVATKKEIIFYTTSSVTSLCLERRHEPVPSSNTSLLLHWIEFALAHTKAPIGVYQM
jgi:hypothetical protein